MWAASYNPFGQATIITSIATTSNPTITSNLRLPGQYEENETGLYYNFKRYYDPNTGRYITQDPIGLSGGINRYKYAEANPTYYTDPTGECAMCVAYAACVSICMVEDAAINAATGECNQWGNSAKGCAVSCAIPFGLGALGRGLGKAIRRLGGVR